MVKFATFAVEQWMDKHETSAKYNISETCCDSITLQHLQSLACPTSPSTCPATPSNPHPTLSSIPFPPTTKLTYGHIRGSPELRQNICNLYNTYTLSRTETPLVPSEVLITPGAIAANFLLFYSLVGKGDHVICVYPTYQALYAVAESFGAEVDLWKMDVEKGENPCLGKLRSLIRKPDAHGNGGTKLIVINNPNNPTGSVMQAQYLKDLVSIAREAGNIPILSDEVYRPIFHHGTPTPPSILDIYSHGISTGSMSKAFSLAGIRVGWIATRLQLVIETCAQARDYTTISVSRLDDSVATLALVPGTVKRIIERNLELANTNGALLRKYITEIFPNGSARYTVPQGGTTAFIQFLNPNTGEPVDDVAFCTELMETEKLLIMPGCSCFGHDKDFKGYVRIGYCCATRELKEGMDVLAGYLKEKWGKVEEVKERAVVSVTEVEVEVA